MHLATITTEYKIISLAHHTHTAAVFFSCMLVLSCTAVIDCFLCTLYFVFFIVFLFCLVATLIYCYVYLAIQLPDCKYVIIKLS